MSSKLLSHVQGNAVAYLALFVALSGTAFAATALPRNSVGTAQLKKGAVTGKKIRPGSIAGKQVRKDTLTGRNIRESTLGRVPLAGRATHAETATSATGAARLGGRPPSAFLDAGGTAANADRLDGIDSAVFGTTQTYAGMNLEPRDSTATAKAYQGTGAISCTGTPDDFTTRVQLPQGARIDRLSYRFVDNSPLVSGGLALIAFDTFEQSGLLTTTIVQAASTGDDGDRRNATATPTTPHTIDNGRYSYQLVWSPTACSADSQLVGGAVGYTMPTG